MNYKEKLNKLYEDIQLTLNHYGEWVKLKTAIPVILKYYLKDKRTTVWIKKRPSKSVGGGIEYRYDVFVNNNKIATYDSVVDAKKSAARNMNKIAPW